MRIPPFFGTRRTFVRLRPQTAVSARIEQPESRCYSPHSANADSSPQRGELAAKRTEGAPPSKEPTMSRTIYRALLRLTAPEEFENKSNDDNDNDNDNE